MSELKVKYLQHAYASEADWQARNPMLKNGEEGYALVTVNGIEHLRKKVGPGRWNDLKYFDGVVWTDSSPVTNPIGDAQGSLEGLTPIQILDKMLNTYQTPVVSSVRNDAGGSSAATANIEIGNAVSAPVNVSYSVSNQSNLIDSLPIEVLAGGRFTNEGRFNLGTVTLTHNGFAPTGLDQIDIGVRAYHKEGTTGFSYTHIQFNPAIIYGVSQTDALTPENIMQMNERNKVVSRDYTRDYPFSSAGYSVLCIPDMLNPQNPTFTDVTDPNAPSGYAMEDLGLMVINNEIATYTYHVYRSTYYVLNSGILRVS